MLPGPKDPRVAYKGVNNVCRYRLNALYIKATLTETTSNNKKPISDYQKTNSRRDSVAHVIFQTRTQEKLQQHFAIMFGN